jgi:multiple sugar transport system permease protein
MSAEMLLQASRATRLNSFHKVLTRLQHGLIYLVLGLIGFGFIAPFLWMILTALKPTPQILVFPPVIIPSPLQWNNFVEAMNHVPFARYFQNSLFLCTTVLIGTLISNTLIAYGFSRIQWRGRDVVFVIVLATMMLPPQVTMIPIYVIFRKLGWVGGYLPLIVPAYLGSPFFIFLLRQFFLGIPSELSDAARIDGCSEFGILWYVIVPLAKPVLVTVGLLSFINTWNDFQGPLIYLTDQNLYTVSLGLQQFIQRYFTPWNLLMAAAALVILPVLLVFIYAQRYIVEGISLTGFGGR